MKSIQWYKVIRPNGHIQYATMRNGYYLINDSGFAIGHLDAVSVTAIDGMPPENNELTYVCFDADSENSFRAIVNSNYRWNGWECPFIHVDDVFRMMEHITRDDNWITYTIDGEDIIIVEPDYEETTRIEPTMKDGEKYYYFGDMGWIFEIARFLYEDEMESHTNNQ